MKSGIELKEIVRIVKSGFVGALVVSGACIGLFLLGFAYRNEVIAHWFQNTFARFSMGEILLTTGGIGFILGLVFRKRFTLKKEVVLVAVFSIPFIIGAWMLNAIGRRVAVPHSIALADCTNAVTGIQLKTPRGHAFQLELQVPGASFLPSSGKWVSTYKFSGWLNISSNGVAVAKLPLSSETAWLTGGGYVLTGAGLQNTNVPPLSDFIRPGGDYHFEIQLNPPPPTNASILLYWRESRIDK